jgi:hypothetical protein
VDTGIFNESRYFDVFFEVAKASPTDLLIRIRAINRGPDAAPLALLPTIFAHYGEAATQAWRALAGLG